MKKNILLLLMLVLSINTYAQFGETVVKTMKHKGLLREYRIYIPSSYVAGKAVPLVLNMHGYGSNAAQQEFYGEFRFLADAENFLVVHPNGTETMPGSGVLYYNVGFFPSTIDDIGFMTAILDSVSAEYSINQKKIYATGMSNGGFMSYELACTTNRFAAIASVTGDITVANFPKCKNAPPIPVMQFHGTADATVPYAGNANFLHVDTLVKFWVKQNACNPVPTVTAIPDKDPNDGATAERFVYSGGKKGTTVEFWKIKNGTHVWPGSFLNLGVTCQDFNASNEIWRFFKQYSLITPTTEINQLALSVYPNPSSDILNIELPDAGEYTLQVIDNQGKMYINNTHFNANTIAIDHLPTGIYFIKMSNENGVATQRFVKQ